MANDDKVRPIIKKVIKVSGGGHHGGAWKVAYADFATAMMAFFMLMWLLNVAPPETLAGLADYFSPTSADVPGSSGVKEINPAESDKTGQNPSETVLISNPGPPPSGAENDGDKTSSNLESKSADEMALELQERMQELEDEAFEEIQEQLRLAIQQSPALSEISEQLILEITEDGLRIQLIDKDQRAMFRPGSADLYNYAQAMIREVGLSVQDLPNRVAIVGHTDDGNFLAPDGSSNWDLSANRANSARKVLGNSGVTNDRIFEVTGKAGNDPLYPDQPNRTENRRITILIIRESPVVPPSFRGN
ncbi:MAG: OmpA family protein [Kordiimonadaceae bacterium]|nr:OmpA family protein [Kordiimonadaceae bacterium]